MTKPLTGPVLDVLAPSVRNVWIERAPGYIHLSALTWEEVVANVCLTARAAAAMDGLTPSQVVERQIAAVQAGKVDGSSTGSRPDRVSAFCGCLVGHAGDAVGHYFLNEGDLSDDPLFHAARGGDDDLVDWAPIEILAYMLLPREQRTLRSKLVIRALKQAQAVLDAEAATV